MSGQFTPPRVTIEEVNNRGYSIPRKLRGSNKALSGRQLQEAEAPWASEEGLGISLEKIIAYSVARTRAILQGCVMSPSKKQKEIAEVAAQQNQPKQVMHTASYHSPYISEYVGNHPTTYVASASQPQASCPQPPPPLPLQPAYSRGQQPEGSQQTHHQRDFREESEARTVNSIVPESKHIY
jgi:hypothetical protein